jgi:hypothetical protein
MVVGLAIDTSRYGKSNYILLKGHLKSICNRYKSLVVAYYKDPYAPTDFIDRLVAENMGIKPEPFSPIFPNAFEISIEAFKKAFWDCYKRVVAMSDHLIVMTRIGNPSNCVTCFESVAKECGKSIIHI